jgi:hypothetical protein
MNLDDLIESLEAIRAISNDVTSRAPVYFQVRNEPLDLRDIGRQRFPVHKVFAQNDPPMIVLTSTVQSESF